MTFHYEVFGTNFNAEFLSKRKTYKPLRITHPWIFLGHVANGNVLNELKKQVYKVGKTNTKHYTMYWPTKFGCFVAFCIGQDLTFSRKNYSLRTRSWPLWLIGSCFIQYSSSFLKTEIFRNVFAIVP